MDNVITHCLKFYNQNSNTITVNAICGYFETYDFDTSSKYDTPFISTSDFTCEDCKAEYALGLLADLP